MLVLPIENLRSGMTLAKPVLHPDRSDLLLLGQGYELDAKTISLLHTNRITHVWISFPGLEELDGKVSVDIARGHMELYHVLNRSIDKLEQRVAVKMNVQKYKKAVHHMLAEIVEHSGHDAITGQLRLCGPRLAGHQANCSYLSLLIGAHLAGYLRKQRRSLPSDVADNTTQLGLGALLHDVGKANMPDELRDIRVFDDEGMWEEYRYHTVSGYEEVRDHVSPIAAHVVLHHHQRYDGSGFPAMARMQGAEPRTLAGDKIHVFSRIVAVVDAFDHLLCPKGEPAPTIAAISELCSSRFKGWFDPVVVEALLRLVPPFMIGQVVRLSDGTEGVITENHPDSPARPTVKVLTGPISESDTKVLARPIDLRMARTLHVTMVDGVDVSAHTLRQGGYGPASAGAA